MLKIIVLKKKILLIILFTIITILTIAYILGNSYYDKIYGANVNIKKKTTYLYIPSGANFRTVLDSLKSKNILRNINSFEWVANKKKYNNKIKAGRYLISNNMSNNELVNMLRAGKQKPLQVTINNIRTKEQLSGKIAGYIEADSIEIISLLNDEATLDKYDFNSRNILSMFLPNTYEFYWNTSANLFLKRMNREYKKFWNNNRLAKAKKIGLNEYEVSVLASIVQAEQSLHNEEKVIIAGLYINRLKRGILLQSDPTIVYAIGDFSIRRVLNKDKDIDSPFNTYKYAGLPPAPINLPEISSLDAVLNYKKHDYLFMCAKDDFSGYHYFSKTNRQHNIYAKRYHRALSKKGIRR